MYNICDESVYPGTEIIYVILSCFVSINAETYNQNDLNIE